MAGYFAGVASCWLIIFLSVLRPYSFFQTQLLPHFFYATNLLNFDT